MDRLGPPVETHLEEDLRQGVGDEVVEGPLEPRGQEAEEDGEGKDDHVAGSLWNEYTRMPSPMHGTLGFVVDQEVPVPLTHPHDDEAPGAEEVRHLLAVQGGEELTGAAEDEVEGDRDHLASLMV
jgi:hypothetical protein